MERDAAARPRLTVLGSGTVIPTGRRATSCYLVDDAAGGRALVDLGPGALHRAAVAGCTLVDLDAVLLTHVHPDHCADLVALRFALGNPSLARAWAEHGPRPPIRLFGHPDVATLSTRLEQAWPGWLDRDQERLAFTALEPGPFEVPLAAEARAYRIAHHTTSLGYRLTFAGGATLAFSGDADLGAELEDLARDVDVLVLEAAVPDGSGVPGHLSPREAGAVAARAGVGHLVLTHFYPEVERTPIEAEVREAFEGRLTLAHDGGVLTLP